MDTPSIPNTGRILDYWLGGSHHFPVDIEAAKVFEQACSTLPQVFCTLRNYIGRVSRYIESQGINQFIVFGAGLPTCGNVHEAVPQAKVLYTDIDEANVQLGQELLDNHPNANYTFCDAANLESLDQLTVNETLGSVQKLGMVFVGVSAFIPDDVLTHILDQLYDWVPVGSFLALDFDGEALQNYPSVLELLDSLDAHLYMRNPSTIKPLLGRWQLSEQGILPVSIWEADLPQVRDSDEPVFMYGCVVYK
jgi:hypothetical protein